MRRSDATAFFTDRRRRLVGMVEHAMGKEVLRDVNDADYSGGGEGPDAFQA